jgi:hypothetical protein
MQTMSGFLDEIEIPVVDEPSEGKSGLSKLHLASRTQAAAYALREGYTSLYQEE